MKNQLSLCLFALFIALLFENCTAPRNIIESGKVTPKGHVRAGIGTTTYLPTAFSGEAKKVLDSGIKRAGGDTVLLREDAGNITSALLSFGLDPLTQTFDLFVRYGLVDNLDLGYKFTGGAHVLDVQYQIAGNTGHKMWNWGEGFNSSVAVQYSGQGYSLPGFGDDIQDLIGFEISRKDLMFKFLNSISLGEEEEIGHFGFGMAYNHSFINYGMDPSLVIKKMEEVSGTQIVRHLHPVPEASQSYGAFGLYTNIRVGYKYAYFYASFSAFYQQYGGYSIFEGQEYNGSGFTFIPSIGLQFDI